MKKKIAFYTFGCRLNQAETAAIQQGFGGESYEVVDHRDSPDMLVVNTCTVTENGDARTRKLVKKVSKGNPDVEIALVGCQAQVQKERLLELPNVKWVVGNARKMELADIVETPVSEPQLITPTVQKGSFTVPFTGIDTNHTRANLKVQDGCDFFCTFCEIPYARGRARSRDFENLIAEANQLAEAGHHELILTGINIGTYECDGYRFTDILDTLEQIEDVWRVRIASIEPTTIDEAVIYRMAAENKLCRFLHIPIQAATDKILSAMQRKYTLTEFTEFLTFVTTTVKDVGIGTDIIVGFPGETDADFEEGYERLIDLPISFFHVFSYSDREHAKSSKYDDKVSREVIASRSQRLRDLGDRKRRMYAEQFLGTTQHVLFEHQKNGIWSGLTDTYIRVKTTSDLNLKNRLLPVCLEQIDGQTVSGTLK